MKFKVTAIPKAAMDELVRQAFTTDGTTARFPAIESRVWEFEAMDESDARDLFQAALDARHPNVRGYVILSVACASAGPGTKS